MDAKDVKRLQERARDDRFAGYSFAWELEQVAQAYLDLLAKQEGTVLIPEDVYENYKESHHKWCEIQARIK